MNKEIKYNDFIFNMFVWINGKSYLFYFGKV